MNETWPKRKPSRSLVISLGAALLLTVSSATPSRADGERDLAKASQNPVGNLISVPFENNVLFNIGPSDSTAYKLNLKPVYPVNIGKLNLINRFIAPIMYTEGQDRPTLRDRSYLGGGSTPIGLGQGSAFGLGDITYQAFLSPARPGKIIWGVGPALVVPSATEDRYKSRKWSLGPAAVVLATPGKWVLGALMQNVWSIAGSSSANDINSFLLQPFVNYNMEDGWYLTTGPNITANWEAGSSDRWTVPVGGGFGRLVRHGKQPVDYRLAGYYNVERPTAAPDWNLQFTVKLLFPKSK